MGNWEANLVFRTPTDGREPLPDRERVTAGVAGWTYLTDELENYEELRAALVDILGPALLSMVCDSSFAEVIGYLDGEPQWTAFINQDCAGPDYDVYPPDLPPAEDEDLLDRITAWAQGAGAPPVDRDRLRQVFATSYVFADDGLLALEQLLGVVSPQIRPYDDDLRSDYDVVVSAPTGETISDRAIAEIEHVLRGEADPDQPDGKRHRVDFFVPKTHEPAVAVPALAAVLRQLGLPPATQVYWTGCDGDTPLAELDQ